MIHRIQGKRKANALILVLISTWISSWFHFAFAANEGGTVYAAGAQPAPSGAVQTLQVLPVDDAYVRWGQYAGINYGTDPKLLVKNMDADKNVTRQTFMKFDLRHISGKVESAKLMFFGAVTDGGGTNVDVKLYEVHDDRWSEDTLTWNAKPPIGSAINSLNVNRTQQWRELDVTSYALRQFADDRVVSVALLQDQASGLLAEINSKESASNRPYLQITYTPLQDNTAPVWPPGSRLQAANVSSEGVTLNWTAAADDQAVTDYRIFVNGEAAGTVTGSTYQYQVTGLSENRNYLFRVEAGDPAGNWSENGPSLQVDIPMTRQFAPTDDTYVNAGAKAETGFGSAAELLVKTNVPDLTRHAYMKFDIAPYTGDIGSAKLRVYGAVTDGGGTEIDVWLYGVEDDAWSEGTMTWSTKAAPEHYLATVHMDKTKKWHEFDVTSFVKSQSSGNKKASFVLLQQSPNGLAVTLNSKENSANRPSLEISSARISERVPSWPSGSTLQYSNADETGLRLSWTAAADPGGVTGYRIYKNGFLLDTVGGQTLSYPVVGLGTGTKYTFKVEAGNAQGQWSSDGPYATMTTPVTKLEQLSLGNVFQRGEPIRFKIVTPRSTVAWEVYDAWDNSVAQGRQGDVDGTFLLNVPLDKAGYFTLKAMAIAENKTPVELSTPFAVVSPFDVNAVESSPFGVAAHLHRTSSGWTSELSKLIQYAGIKNVRGGMEWSSIEKQKDVYAFTPEPDGYMARLQKDGLDFLLVAGYNNPLYDNNSTPYTDAGRQGFANYAKAYTDHYGEQTSWVEVYNEFNIAFGDRGSGPADSRPDYYVPLLKQTYETLKSSRPGITVVGMVTAGVPLDWMEEVFKLGGLQYMDVVSIHPYRYPQTPEGMVDELRSVQNLIKKYNNGQLKPIWISEIGWPTFQSERGVDEKTQAEYLVRSYVLALANGVDKIFWYNLMNDGLQADYNEHNFGLIRNALDSRGAYTPKPAYSSYAAMIRELTGADFVHQDATGSDIKSFLFRKDGEDTRVVWSLKPVQAAIRTANPVQLTDLMGNTETYMPYKGKVYVTLTGEPVYMKGSVEGIAEDTTFMVIGDRAAIGEPVKLAMAVSNGDAAPMTVTVDVEGKQYSLQTPGGTRVEQPFTVAGLNQAGKRIVKGELWAGGGKIGRWVQAVSVERPISLKVTPLITDREAKQGEIRLQLHNFSALRTYKVVSAVWQAHTRSGTISLGSDLPAETGQTITIAMDDLEFGLSYPAKVTVYFEGTDPVVYEGKLDFNPVALTTVIVDGVPDPGTVPPTIELSKGTVKMNQGYTGPPDLDGSAWLHWDRGALYLIAKIKDDVQSAPSSDGEIWKNDSIQFAIAAGTPGDSKEWYEYGVSGTPGGPVLYRWNAPAGISRGPVHNGQVRIVRDEAQKETFYEMALPWSELSPAAPGDGRLLSFSLLVNDNDGSGREGYIEWGSGIGSGKDPSKFRTIQLLTDNGTTLAVTNASGVYSDEVNLQAVLKDRNDQPIEGESISFDVDGMSVGISQTDSQGKAELKYKVAIGGKTDGTSRDARIHAAYIPDAASRYRGSEASGTLNVTQESASIVYAGTRVGSSLEGVTLAAKVVQEQDGGSGELAGLPVQFLVSAIQPDGTAIPVASTVTGTVYGTVTSSVYATDSGGNVSLAKPLPAGLYEIRTKLLINPYYVAAESVSSIAVSEPGAARVEINGFVDLPAAQPFMGEKAGKLHINIGGQHRRLHAEPLGRELVFKEIDWQVIAGNRAYLQGKAESGGESYTVRIMLQMPISAEKHGKYQLAVIIWKGNDTTVSPSYEMYGVTLSGNVEFKSIP